MNNTKNPKIGITTWRRDLPNYTGENDLYTLHIEYANRVLEAGGVPFLLAHISPDDVSVYIDSLDGLILTGGDDIDPTQYGEENNGLSFGVRPSVDHYEMNLIHEAKKAHLPTLGICRGHQILQVAFGGRILQEIHDTYPKHPKLKPKPDPETRHPVFLESESVLSKIYDSRVIRVNSLHHQCITSIGEGFRTVGVSEDGIIEAVESNTPWFSLGVQWHPEKMREGEPLFHFFVNEVKKISMAEPLERS